MVFTSSHGTDFFLSGGVQVVEMIHLDCRIQHQTALSALQPQPNISPLNVIDNQIKSNQLNSTPRVSKDSGFELWEFFHLSIRPPVPLHCSVTVWGSLYQTPPLPHSSPPSLHPPQPTTTPPPTPVPGNSGSPSKTCYSHTYPTTSSGVPLRKKK